MKIFVLRNDGETMGTSVFPDHRVVCFLLVDIANMLRTWKQVLELFDELV